MSNNSWLQTPVEDRHAVLEQWKAFLTEEKYGQPIQDIETQAWMSQVLTTTARDGILNVKSLANRYLAEAQESGKEVTQILSEASDYGVPWDSTGFSGTGSDTIGAYGKLILPVFRRLAPQLIAPAFMGTQPMAGPNGFVVSLKAHYKGNGTQRLATGKGIIFVLSSSVDAATEWAPDKTSAIGDFDATAVGHVTQAVSNATGIVRFREGTKVLVEESTAATFNAINDLSVGNGAAGGQAVRSVLAKFDSEAGYNRFFKNYSWGDNLPDYTDVTGTENTSTYAGAGVEIQEMGIVTTKSPVTANERKLKATFPAETAEDLQAQLSLDLRKELIAILTTELMAEMNREQVDLINSSATSLTSYSVDSGSDGRWHLEKLRGLKMKLDREAMQIKIQTRRGAGNRLLLSPDVMVGLKQLPEFKFAETNGVLSLENTYAGKLGEFEVYTDTFAESDYATIAYRGTSPIDAGYFYCPYIGLTFGEAKHPETVFDTILAFRTRYGMLENPYGGELYFRNLPIADMDQIGFN